MYKNIIQKNLKRNKKNSKSSEIQRDLDGGVVSMPTANIKKAIDIPTGEYTGIIKDNKIATHQTYEYHETFIEVQKDDNPILKVGCPFDVSEKTTLGRLLQRFGAKLEVGKDIKTEDYLKVGMAVKFSILRAKGKNTDVIFSNIQPDTLCPSEEKVE